MMAVKATITAIDIIMSLIMADMAFKSRNESTVFIPTAFTLLLISNVVALWI